MRQAPDAASRRSLVVVAVLVAIAAALRLYGLEHAPPGLNQDEAINAWNAQCLLKTGRDMVGQRWPLFYFHSIGDNRTPLLIDLMVPFLAMFGMSVHTMRMVPAVFGVACVPLAFFVGRRLAGTSVGLVAAGLLTFNPWHFSSTRWAIDGSIVSFLSLAALATMLLARLPLADRESGEPRAGLAALAGLVSGLVCYGYWAIRLHHPVFLAAIAVAAIAHGPSRRRLSTRAGVQSVVAFVMGFALTFGPLALEHLRDPAIAQRAAMTRLWDPGTPLPEIGRRVFERYLLHFGPRFRFVSGDVDPGNAPADSGAFEWAVLPLLLAGVAFAAARARRSVTAGVLLAMALTYPVGDLAGRYDGVHAFRSAPGMVPLLLVAAYGAVAGFEWLERRGRALAIGATSLLTVALLGQDARSMHTYFTSWPNRPPVYFLFHTDFMQAVRAVRSRAATHRYDAVFWTATGVNMPFSLTLVGLDYPPARWLADEKRKGRTADGWDYYLRFGSNWFLYGQEVRSDIEAMQSDGQPQHVLMVVRPGEFGLQNPVHVVRGPDGRELLWLCEGEL